MIRLASLPTGRSLGDRTWSARHRGLCVLLVVQAVVLLVLAAYRHEDAVDVAASGFVVFGLTGVALWSRPGRRVRASAVALGLFSESALLVLLMEGRIEGHFHFFVMAAALALYEDTVPFLLGAVFVALQHGLMGTLLPQLVYAEHDHEHSPWLWAGLHSAFFFAAAIAQMSTWAANEQIRQSLRASRVKEASERTRAERFFTTAATPTVVLDAQGHISEANPAMAELVQLAVEDLVGLDYFLTVGDATGERRAAYLAAMAGEAELRPVIEQDVNTASSDVRTVRWHVAILRDDRGAAIGTLASGEDVTEQRRAEAETRRDRQDLATLGELTRRVAAIDDARQEVVDAVRTMTGASFVACLEPDGDDALVITAVDGTDELPVGSRLPLGGASSASGTAFLTGEAFFVADTDGHPGVARGFVERTGAKSALLQPAFIGDRVVAVLSVAWTHHVADISSREAGLAGVLSTELALAVERARQVRELEAAVITDPLTGAKNRRGWEEALAGELARADRSERPLSALLLDLDKFKELNDCEGHAAGDQVLRACVDAWTAELRSTDTLARLGGDEFAALLPNCESADARGLAARLAAVCPHEGGASVGAATWNRLEDASTFIARADAHLYAEKAERHQRLLGDPDRRRVVDQLRDANAPHALDSLADVAARAIDAPIVAVNLVDDGGQVSIGSVGLERTSAPLEESICSLPTVTARPLVVGDAAESPQLRDHAAVTDGGICAYLGVPLVHPDGHVLGALCAADTEPHEWTADDLQMLEGLAPTVVRELLSAQGGPPAGLRAGPSATTASGTRSR